MCLVLGMQCTRDGVNSALDRFGVYSVTKTTISGNKKQYRHYLVPSPYSDMQCLGIWLTKEHARDKLEGKKGVAVLSCP
jgi:hypothetical protein